MAIAFVQKTSVAYSTIGADVNVVFPGNTTAGNLIIIAHAASNSQPVTISGFTLDKASVASTSPTKSALFSQPNCTGGTTTYTITGPSAGSFSVQGYEFSGVLTTTPVEATDRADDSAPLTAPVGGDTGVTTTGADLIFAAFSFDRQPSPVKPTGWDDGVTPTTATGVSDGFFTYKIFSGTSTNEKGIISSSATHYNGVIVAYKPAAGGGTVGAASIFRQISGLGA